MSTKSTIVYGEDFHLYRECFDDDHIYIELDTAKVITSEDGVEIAIPLDIWEYIRKYSLEDGLKDDETDESLVARVTARVDERIADYVKDKETTGKGLSRFYGAFIYGMADSPRDEQIERGVTHFKNVREKKNELYGTLRALRELNGN